MSSPLLPKEPDLQSGAFADSLPTHVKCFQVCCNAKVSDGKAGSPSAKLVSNERR